MKQNKEVDEVAIEILAAGVVPDQVADHVHNKCAHTATTKDIRSQTAGKNILKRLQTPIRGTTQPKKRNPASPAAKAKGTG